MGFRRPILKLVWPADSDLHGLEVRIRRLSIGEVLELIPMEDDESVNYLDYLAERLSRCLVSWNLDGPDGSPLPTGIDGIRLADRDLIEDILRTARVATTRVAPPLPEGSNSGTSFPEVSIPTETLSPNPTNSSVPA